MYWGLGSLERGGREGEAWSGARSLPNRPAFPRVDKWATVARPGVSRRRRPRVSEEVNYMRAHTRKYFINLPLINQIVPVRPPI